MAATSDNYDIVTSGITYTIAADYVKPEGAGETAHHQIVKVAYGENDTVIYASTSTPLPVGVSGSWENYNFIPSSGINSLATTIVGITGTSLTVMGVSGGGVPIGITVGTLNVAPVGLTGSWGRYEFLPTSGFYSIATTIVGTTGTSLTVAGVSGGVPVGITVGTLTVVGVSGGVAVGITVGTLNVAGSSFSIRNLYGGTSSGSTVGIDYVGIQGIESGYPVGIQGIASGYPVGITVSAPLPVTVSSFASLSLSNLGN